MLVTQGDIAKQVGISQKTVSRCFLSPDSVNPKTLKKVQQVAIELGYRLNSAAQSMRTGKFNSLAFLHDGHHARSQLNPAVLNSIAGEANRKGLQLYFARIPDVELDSTEEMPQVLQRFSTDGFLLNYHGALPPALEIHIQQLKLPHVWLNNKREFSSVYLDELDAGKRACEYLISRGHKRIVYVDTVFPEVSTQSLHYSRIDRAKGYHLAMEDAGFVPEQIMVSEPHTSSTCSEQAKQVLTRDNGPTGFIFNGNELKTFFYVAIKHCRLSIPEDREFFMFSDNEEKSYLGVNIPHLKAPWNTLCRQGMNMLDEYINGGNRLKSISIPYAGPNMEQ